ncbi:MAG: DNA-directed RNA polymerase subunit beta' [Candidatus Paceibacterota bacterium]
MEKRDNPLNALNPEKVHSIKLSLASPERVKEWSHGEVTKPETINYRTQRSEKDGLFDERIFGPEKDYECYCGKYAGIRYKGIVCEKCGVEVTRAIVRRERMGHIELAAPIAHVWFVRGVPSRMSLILGLKKSDLEKVIYFSGYIVSSVDETAREKLLNDLQRQYKERHKAVADKKEAAKLDERFQKMKNELEELRAGMVIDEGDYDRFSSKYASCFEAEIGAEAIYELFKKVDIEKLVDELEEQYQQSGSKAEKMRLRKRLSLLTSMRDSKQRPEWMFLQRLPVMPPSLRPMVSLGGGRHATSDVNDLYRRVINRNNRLAKLQEINAPHVILRNEKRILQEAVDALLDNSIRRGSSFTSSGGNRRQLKSLADNLKGKQGIFRRNLLGKRVDYSGRSVIVIGPELALDECGLPKYMALELFRPFVINQLLEREFAHNVRGANKLIDQGSDEVWEILERVIKGKYVLLNRAPTLHRLGIQAFRPRLIEGHAIQVHPLVCAAFNADFDGDQMAVHVPLSEEAQTEAREIMASNKNLLKPGTGSPIVSADKDVILGSYWLTKIPAEEAEGGEEIKKEEIQHFSSPNSAITANNYNKVNLRERIFVLPTDSERYAAFAGEMFCTSVGRLIFNSLLPSDFPFVNKKIDSGVAKKIVDDLIERYGVEGTPGILDDIKRAGFKYATYAGITFGLNEVTVPEGKPKLLDEAQAKVDEVTDHYDEGLVSDDERRREVIKIWHETKAKLGEMLSENLDQNGSVMDMLSSGARGSMGQVNNMSGMKGLIQDNKGEILDFPVKTSSKEGHTPIEYFTTTHGSRKGLTDTALKTATAGFLTRRLFDVAQDVIVSMEDCGTKESITIKEENLSGIVVPISKGAQGRFLAQDVVTEEGEKIFSADDYLTRDDARKFDDVEVESIEVRSPMTCEAPRGVCQKCYGVDHGNNRPVEIGEAVGTVAAQAIGEPGTQLTMRTFHAGGVASEEGDITHGLPRVEQLFEAREPKMPAIVSEVDGTVTNITVEEKKLSITVLPNEGQKKKEALIYTAPSRRSAVVEEGDEVTAGQLLSDGAANLSEVFKYGGKAVAQNYVIREVNKIYELQGASISRKHLEVMVKQMFSRLKIRKPGDTRFTVGDVVEEAELREENSRMKEEGQKPAEADQLLKGITRVALSRKSFLSAASFQHTTRILIDAAVRGSEDNLVGLKENVILGRLIPAGTGFPGSPKAEMVARHKKK